MNINKIPSNCPFCNKKLCDSDNILYCKNDTCHYIYVYYKNASILKIKNYDKNSCNFTCIIENNEANVEIFTSPHIDSVNIKICIDSDIDYNYLLNTIEKIFNNINDLQ